MRLFYSLVLVLVCFLTQGKDFTTPVNFIGICDASAVVALGNETVVVADDESNSLLLYSRLSGGLPLGAVDLSRFLAAERKSPEADIEAGARIDDHIYWITSHGRNSTGKIRVNRRQFFATSITIFNREVQLKPVGIPYRNLLQDLVADPRLRVFDLRRAASLPPKSTAALNIEGLAATPEGHLLLGFRNPIPDGKALVVPLLNPANLIGGGRARFGMPVLLDPGGFGVRSLELVGDHYLIIGGAAQGNGDASRLYSWKGGSDQPQLVEGVDFEGLNPEALAACEGLSGETLLFVTSDDGAVLTGGKPCKDLKDPNEKSFRGVILKLPDSSS